METRHALPDRGLEGDRYATGTGHWSPMRRSGDGLTLIDARVVDGLAASGLARDATRRNVITRGIDLDALIGHTFRIGEVTCRAVRRCRACEPPYRSAVAVTSTATPPRRSSATARRSRSW